MADITYAKAGETPANWHNLEVFDRDAGDFVKAVTEINVAEGWLVRYVLDANGRLVLDGGRTVTERLTGRFALIERPR